jgi:Ca-activated chloride channel family protein
MIRLANPEFLFLLLAFPLLWGVLRLVGHRRPRGHRPAVSFANILALGRTAGGWRARLLPLLPATRIVALIMLVLALARPQLEDWETLAGSGLDIMICLDMSGSMNAVDMDFDEIGAYQERGEEPPSRFKMAVETLKQFILDRAGDRVGLVVFSSEAYLKFPLTLDYDTVLHQLDALVLDNMERDRRFPGCTNGCTINGEKTAVGDALSKAYKRLEKSTAKGKLIVLITDGNDNASKLKPMDVARYIGDQPDGQRPGVYAFLVGGGPKSKIPVNHNGRLLKQMGFLSYAPYDEQVDEEKIRDMVEAARGTFHVSYDPAAFQTSFAALEKSEYLEQKVARHKDIFWPFAAAAVALLLLEFLARVTLLRRYP